MRSGEWLITGIRITGMIDWTSRIWVKMESLEGARQPENPGQVLPSWGTRIDRLIVFFIDLVRVGAPSRVGS